MAHSAPILFAALLFGASSLPATADVITYQYTVDTTSQSGNYGYIDVELNVGPQGTPGPVFAAVFDFSGAALNPFDNNNDELGTATGSLPDSLSISNSGFNDYFEGLTFGTYVSFDVTLDGSGVSQTGSANYGAGTAFQIFFFDSGGSNNLFTVDPTTGAAGLVDIAANGIPTTTGDLTVVPEPASLRYLLCACLAALLIAVRLKRSATASI
jgi:hypothetical protein